MGWGRGQRGLTSVETPRLRQARSPACSHLCQHRTEAGWGSLRTRVGCEGGQEEAPFTSLPPPACGLWSAVCPRPPAGTEAAAGGEARVPPEESEDAQTQDPPPGDGGAGQGGV